MRILKWKNENSLERKIGKSIILTILLGSVFLTVAFVTLFDIIIKEDRRSLLNALGQNTLSVIERPFSLGDFSEVQSLIQVENLPNFVKSVEVFDSSKAKRAYNLNDSNSCSYVEPIKIEIPDSDGLVNSGYIIISSTTCDLKKRFLSVVVFSALLISILIMASQLLARRIAARILKPTMDVIAKASYGDSFNKDLLNSTPKEFRPLIQKLSEVYEDTMLDSILHNLSSPLRVLKLILSKHKEKLPQKDYSEAWSNVLQIAHYINPGQGSERAAIGGKKMYFLDLLLEGLTYGKNEEFKDKKDKSVEVRYLSEVSSFGAFPDIPEAPLREILSNLINNSYDAIQKSGHINLRVKELAQTVQIKVYDDGKGIAEKDINKIFDKDVSLKGSSGFGLYHARKVINKYGGDIEVVKSEIGMGTIFALTIPKETTPKWFPKEINVSKFSKFVLVDDSKVYGFDWNMREELAKKTHYYFSSKEGLEVWLKNDLIDKNDCFFVVDFEFGGENYHGVDIINSLELPNAIISTNKLRSPKAYDLCLKNDLKLLPKPLIQDLKIISEEQSISDSVQAIFVDDQDTSYLIDNLKDEFKINAKSFQNPDDLLNDLEGLSQDTKIFLDRNLGKDKLTGPQIAKKLNEQGYYNLIAYTGSKKNVFKDEEKSLFLGHLSTLTETRMVADIILGNEFPSWV